jgi:sugar/nucleoside kinase (ribokinase family)
LNSTTPADRGILCSGSVVYDTLVKPVDTLRWGTTTLVDCLEYHVGGNGANTATALAVLGVPVRLISTVGRDQEGDFALSRLAKAKVDTTYIWQVDQPTPATVVLVDASGNRAFLHRLGASNEAFYQPIHFTPALCHGMAHYHLASLFILPRLRAHAAETLADACRAGLTTSLDTNWDAQGRWMRDLAGCLPYLDYLFMNEDESLHITGSADPATGAAIVQARGVRVAIMKLSGRGCAIYSEDREIVCPAFEVEVIDTTGAGDCFVAGFLAAISRGASLKDAGDFANAVGARSVKHVGAVTGVRSTSETEAWMRSARRRLF